MSAGGVTRFVQLSDTHIRRHGKLAYRKVDTAAALKRAVAHVNALAGAVGGIDAVFATGDLVDMGSADEYAMFRDIVAPLVAPLYVLPGNHDERETMRAAFGDGGYLPAEGTLDYVVELPTLTVLAMDTVVPLRPHGALRAAQVEWLAAQLDRLGERPAVVLLHHPPFDTGIRHMDVQRLLDAGPLLDAVAGRRNLLAIGAGHVHRSVGASHDGLPLVIAPSPSHAVALDHRPDGEPGFRMEPGAVLLWVHQAGAAGGRGLLQWQQSFVDEFEGPYPFFNADGTLID